MRGGMTEHVRFGGVSLVTVREQAWKGCMAYDQMTHAYLVQSATHA